MGDTRYKGIYIYISLSETPLCMGTAIYEVPHIEVLHVGAPIYRGTPI